MVQVAWILAEGVRIVEQKTHLIHPDGFEIPRKSTQIHGISQELAMKQGLSIFTVLKELALVMGKADCIVAHNLNFDLGVIDSEAIRADFQIQFPRRRHCTLYMGRDYLRRKPTVGGKNCARLGSLYEAIMGFPYDHQHDAGSDVRACHQVFCRMRAGLK